jgi:hypothetical protein
MRGWYFIFRDAITSFTYDQLLDITWYAHKTHHNVIVEDAVLFNQGSVPVTVYLAPVRPPSSLASAAGASTNMATLLADIGFSQRGKNYC